MTLVDIHGRLATTVLLYAIFLGAWAFLRFFRKQGVDSSFWGALFIAEILVLLQGGLGAYLWFAGQRPDQTIHLLYGIVTALVIPAAFGYTRGRESRSEMVVYGAVLLFMVGLALRATGTG